MNKKLFRRLLASIKQMKAEIARIEADRIDRDKRIAEWKNAQP